jgi:hypothetical protein
MPKEESFQTAEVEFLQMEKVSEEASVFLPGEEDFKVKVPVESEYAITPLTTVAEVAVMPSGATADKEEVDHRPPTE